MKASEARLRRAERAPPAGARLPAQPEIDQE